MENGLPNINIEPGSLLDLRLNKGILPTLDIAGHTFYVDLQMDKLRPKDDFRSQGINFTEIKDYYDRDRRACMLFPIIQRHANFNKTMFLK